MSFYGHLSFTFLIITIHQEIQLILYYYFKQHKHIQTLCNTVDYLTRITEFHIITFKKHNQTPP